VKFGVEAFRAVNSAVGCILHLRVIFERVGVNHVGAFYVDVPRFFFEASASVEKFADCVKQIDVRLKLRCAEPVRIILGKFRRYAEGGLDEVLSGYAG